jgi:nucleotide-binding universal stress UspA family protein
MKSVLTVLTDPSSAADQLAAASAFARAQGAHLHVLALGVDRMPVTYGDLGASVTIAQAAVERASADAQALAAMARDQLQTEGEGLLWSVEPLLARSGDLASIIARPARLADVVIAQRVADPVRRDEAEMVLEAVLFDGRAPVLLVPAAGSLAAANPQRAVIAWNESTEAAAAIRGALPLLRQAAEVSIAMIAPDPHDADRADPGAGLSTLLARHGIKADISILPRTMPRIGDVILRHVADRNADLLVMGAYGHSRLREAIFGGATREILTDCPVPVLMAH